MLLQKKSSNQSIENYRTHDYVFQRTLAKPVTLCWGGGDEINLCSNLPVRYLFIHYAFNGVH